MPIIPPNHDDDSQHSIDFHAQDLGQMVKAYRKERTPYHDVRFFGHAIQRDGRDKPEPRHVNTRSHPCPALRLSRNQDCYFRIPMTRSVRADGEHLLGQRARFEVSRPDADVAILTIDWDGVEEGNFCDISRRTQAAVATVFPNLVTFTEPGRSFPRKVGAYTRFKVTYENLAPQLRKELENGLNRVLQERLLPFNAPDIKYDGIKGTTTYIYENPHFDQQEANSFSQGMTGKHFKIGSDWFDYEYASAWCKEMSVPLDDLPSKYDLVSNLRGYENEKKFYGIQLLTVNQRARFEMYTPLLEVWMRHYATLVTSPCFACLSGARPNLFNDFHNWLHQSGTELHWKDLLTLLNDDDRDRYTRTEQALNLGIWPKLLPKSKAASLGIDDPMDDAVESDLAADPETEEISSTPKGIQYWINRVYDAGIGIHERYVAAGIVAASKTEDSEDAEFEAMRLVESAGGPASGPTHPEREDHIRRSVEFAMNRSEMAGEVCWLMRHHVGQTQAVIDGIVTPELIETMQKPYKRISLSVEFVAAVYSAYLTIYSRNEKGRVGQKDLARMLKFIGHGANNEKLTFGKNVLVRTGLVQKIANHSAIPNGRKLAARWVIPRSSPVPIWAKPAYPHNKTSSPANPVERPTQTSGNDNPNCPSY